MPVGYASVARACVCVRVCVQVRLCLRADRLRKNLHDDGHPFRHWFFFLPLCSIRSILIIVDNLRAHVLGTYNSRVPVRFCHVSYATLLRHRCAPVRVVCTVHCLFVYRTYTPPVPQVCVDGTLLPCGRLDSADSVSVHLAQPLAPTHDNTMA